MALATIADPIVGIVSHLLAQTDLVNFTKGRIFGGRIPINVGQDLQRDPSPAIAIRYIGGSPDPYTIKIIYPWIEFRLYGRVEQDLGVLYWELFRLFNGMQNTVLSDGVTRVMSIRMDNGFSDFADPDLHTPVGITRASLITQRTPVL